ncbi:MAG TPA: universal stress protein [Methylomirabilota bacterium]|nr:universal stress protein [Methylomirabilota bacterium]
MMAEHVFYRIIVPTDFSVCAEEAWALARRLASAFDAELVLTHVLVEAPLFREGPFTMDKTRQVFEAARRWATETLEGWAATARGAGLRVRVVVRTGIPHEEIRTLATDEKADLIVIGTHGRGGINRALLGSVADRVVRQAPCPVLTVREP